MAEDIEGHMAAGAKARGEGRLEAAVDHYAAALGAARACGERIIVAHIARHLGDIHRENGLAAEAESLLQESLDIYRSSLETRVLDLANTLRPLALIHESLGDVRAAQELWQEARVLYLAVGVAAGVSECDHHLRLTSL